MFHCAQFAPAQEKRTNAYTFFPSANFGMFYGQTEEIVYASSIYKSKMLSELLWDIKPVFYYGLSLDLSQERPLEKWGFFSTLSLKIGIPGKSGKMEDRDWKSVENTALTHYSIHDNISKELIFFDISAGLSFPLGESLLLRPYIAMSYMRFSFTGQHGRGAYARETGGRGSGIYASINDDPTRWSFSGKVIEYTQGWFIGAPAISLSFFFLNHFSAELSFAITPLIFCIDEDQHLTTNFQYQDYMRGGLFLEPGFHFVFFIGKRLQLSLDFSWRYVEKTRGQTYIRSPIGTGNYQPQGDAGAGLSVFDTGLCLKVRL
jgi:outer membrane protease